MDAVISVVAFLRRDEIARFLKDGIAIDERMPNRTMVISNSNKVKPLDMWCAENAMLVAVLINHFQRFAGDLTPVFVNVRGPPSAVWLPWAVAVRVKVGGPAVADARVVATVMM